MRSLPLLTGSWLLVAWLAVMANSPASAADSPPITIDLKAGWSTPPMTLEVLQFVAEESQSAMFPFISWLKSNGILSANLTTEQIYSKTIDGLPSAGPACGWGTAADSKSLLGLYLSTHSGAPAVEAFYQFYKETVLPSFKGSAGFDEECGSWVDWYGTQICDPEALQKAVADFTPGRDYNRYSFDILHRDVPNAPVAVLYADIYSDSFWKLHETLMKMSDDFELAYVLRFKPSPSLKAGGDLYLSGYGVELALKSTEYKVIDDRVQDNGNKPNEGNEDADAEGSEVSKNDSDLDEILHDENGPSVQALSKDEIKDLGVKAAQVILSTQNPLAALVHISQDFPKYSHIIAKAKIDSSVRYAVRKGLVTTLVPGGMSRLYLNNMEVDLRTLDVFSLVDAMRKERVLVSSLTSLQISVDAAIDLLSTPPAPLTKAQTEEVFDVRDPNVYWWNDLEKDKRYKNWPKSLTDLLRPSYPNQLRYLRKNLFNMLFAINLTDLNQLQILMEALGYIEREIPIRFGLAPLVDLTNDESDSVVMAKALSHVWKTGGKKKAKELLTEFFTLVKDGKTATAENPTFAAIDQAFRKVSGSDIAVITTEASSEAVEYIAALRAYTQKIGVDLASGGMFFNGRFIELDQGWTQSMLMKYPKMLESIQMKVYHGEITETTKIYDYILSQDNVFARRNAFLFPSVANPLIVFNLLESSNARPVLYSLRYLQSLEKKPKDISMFMIADYETAAGIEFAKAALKFLGQSSDSRIAFIHNPPSVPRITQKKTLLHEVAYLIAASEESDKIGKLSALLDSLAPNQFDFSDALGDAKDQLTMEDFQALDKQGRGFLLKEMNLPAGSATIIVNGRLVGPFPSRYTLKPEDFELLQNMELDARVTNVATKVKEIIPMDEARTQKKMSDIIMMVTSLINAADLLNKESDFATSEGSAGRVNLSKFIKWKKNPLAFNVGDLENSAIQFIAIVDPSSEVAQKISAILEVLSKVEGVSVRVLLNPVPALSQLPLKRFYRYVLNPQPSFDDAGPAGVFKGIPAEPLLTLGMDVPRAWLIRPVESIYDLDNLKLSTVKSEHLRRGVEAKFQLLNILVEGHVRDSMSPSPPRGAQFILGTPAVPHMVDTITMANLGYIQLKANPGVWELRLREGRSDEIYEIDQVSESYLQKAEAQNGPVKVIVNSFRGVTVYPTVKRRPGKENEDVLESDEAKAKAANNGIWDQLKSRVFGNAAAKAGNETINVFSVASGHLYERFLGIMMLSVVKQTKSPVKFWLIENFLSPTFIDFIPHLAKKYKFTYELVTYKWPHWLRAQTEKQRTIWGYKILFLDVLFPLNLEKVIFVDADQVVRTDLKELVDMDLQGAAYGYTPFCDSRKEMDGFRFWNTGYWKSHMQGRPYHISALYVIDLVRFRQLAAGDRLRQQYQTLSADPNSLANLDQDLPNNMIHNIPMFSLPQEWLWCETWCSDEELKKAKTIDLCNNPLTKEPKLERAKRILPEWEGLDNEVQAVAKKLEKSRQATKAPSSPKKTATSVKETMAKEPEPVVKDEL
ncbi:hypothetical protein HDV05_008022 [Chytridiales sp. JEL 0842]|nr:hypothetical protein HDV05_008022 [Chytridiales sp. JEL 0842]